MIQSCACFKAHLGGGDGGGDGGCKRYYMQSSQLLKAQESHVQTQVSAHR
jgi:hypothetical protein